MDEILSFMNYHAETLLLGAAVIIFVVVIGYTLHKAKKVPGEEHMSKEGVKESLRQQRRAENSMVADMVGDGLLALLAEGKLSPERYDSWQLRFGKRVGLRDLLKPGRKLTEDQRKKACAVRIKYLQKSKPLSFPKEFKKQKPKNVVDAILNGA